MDQYFEAQVPPGLEEWSAREMASLLGAAYLAGASYPGAVQFAYHGDQRRLLQLRSVIAVYWVARYAIPRPRAFLGEANFRALLDQIHAATQHAAAGNLRTLKIGAAGADSAVFRRLESDLARTLGLIPERDSGDLLIRFRRPLDGSDGWEALVRLTRRPLSTRDWRVCDLRGALSGPVGYIMTGLTKPASTDQYLNLFCGSGTLLIERAAHGPAGRMIGVDISRRALECARRNLTAAGIAERVMLSGGEASRLPLAAGSVNVITADLPFGAAVGSHSLNAQLYPIALQEMARVAAPRSRAIILTHEIRLIERVLEQSSLWQLERFLPIVLRGLHPRLYLLRRK